MGEDRRPNLQLRRARGELSQAQLADRVNSAILQATGRMGAITAKSVSDWERGWYTWPIAPVRAALREVLGVAYDAELGFENRRSRASDPADGGVPGRNVSLLDLVRGEEASSADVVDVPGGKSFHGAELAAVRSPGVSVDGVSFSNCRLTCWGVWNGHTVERC
jgi:hypothetical protein